MFITFLVSSIFHEVVMSCITKKLRGYGFGAMMLQLPIVAVQKSRFFKGRTTLNVSQPSCSNPLPFRTLTKCDTMYRTSSFGSR